MRGRRTQHSAIAEIMGGGRWGRAGGRCFSMACNRERILHVEVAADSQHLSPQQMQTEGGRA